MGGSVEPVAGSAASVAWISGMIGLVNMNTTMPAHQGASRVAASWLSRWLRRFGGGRSCCPAEAALSRTRQRRQ